IGDFIGLADRRVVRRRFTRRHGDDGEEQAEADGGTFHRRSPRKQWAAGRWAARQWAEKAVIGPSWDATERRQAAPGLSLRRDRAIGNGELRPVSGVEYPSRSAPAAAMDSLGTSPGATRGTLLLCRNVVRFLVDACASTPLTSSFAAVYYDR